MSEQFTLTVSEIRNLLNDAIRMFLEYRDMRGDNEDGAQIDAVNEIVDGLGADARLTAQGEGPSMLTDAGRAALAHPEPPSPALVNEDGQGEYPVAEMWRGYAEAAEKRAAEAERKLADIQEKVYAHFEHEGEPFASAEEAVKCLMDVHIDDWNEYMGYADSVKALVRAARDVQDAARALIASARETADHAGWEAQNRFWADIASAVARWEAVSATLAALEGGGG